MSPRDSRRQQPIKDASPPPASPKVPLARWIPEPVSDSSRWLARRPAWVPVAGGNARPDQAPDEFDELVDQLDALDGPGPWIED